MQGPVNWRQLDHLAQLWYGILNNEIITAFMRTFSWRTWYFARWRDGRRDTLQKTSRYGWHIFRWCSRDWRISEIHKKSSLVYDASTCKTNKQKSLILIIFKIKYNTKDIYSNRNLLNKTVNTLKFMYFLLTYTMILKRNIISLLYSKSYYMIRLTNYFC